LGGIRLGLPICKPHQCPGAALVDAFGTHCLSCRSGSGRITRHQQLNDLLWYAFGRAKIPAIKEPSGLAEADCKRTNRLTLIPCIKGRGLMWDVTVADNLLPSYPHLTSVSSGSSADGAPSRKITKYIALASIRFFPLAFETLGPICDSGLSLFDDLGGRLVAVTGDPRERAILYLCFSIYQRFSVDIQRCNSICFSDSI